MANKPNFNGHRKQIRAAALLLADLAAMFWAWVLAVAVASGVGRAQFSEWFPLSTLGGVVYTLMTLLVVVSLAVGGQYTRRSAFWEETRVAWRLIVMVALVNFALNFFVQLSNTRTVPVLAWAFVLLMLPLGRLLAREWLIRSGYWVRQALMVGAGDNARQACEAVRRERHMGLRVAGLVDMEAGTGASEAGLQPDAMPVHRMDGDLEAMARRLDCEAIVVALDDHMQRQAGPIVGLLHGAQLEIFVVPALQGLPVQGMQAQHFFSNDVLFLRLQHKLFSRSSRWMKRSIDVLVSGALLLLLSPLMAWVVWRIWREDGAPVIYTQPRVGGDGKDFEFIKFRSMVKDADAILESWKTSQPELYRRYEASNFKLPDDPRVLGVGRWIRRASVDELPQLWNVLRGDMSLVGPRPLLRRELSEYLPDAMALYLQVKPGMTGLWQVSGRSSTTFAQRSMLDSWYARNWSLWVDWVILLKTVRVVLTARGAM
ncbi:undecaprenyl-phosphate galactose phosphotransferase WbaP [Variovorax terrae]|uniref:Undecaprenyl-phosphate galactose phosphotransferase WbaP n=1 Tax=Variovorax terrae TaxID=2923278 RepID=A0A9X1VQD9_9BURK|nr:undecaprenyl-phosphate galactose phosphotransferase WbaP [Variovorax terrae]MCJ0761876.1 undecaprenyl-phosphate galactose phosphotransferase WbaP [Variovorax terrae]